MATGKIAEWTQSSGKAPHRFKMEGDTTEFRIWPSDTPDGMGKGAEVSFGVKTGEYKGNTQYTAADTIVHRPATTPASGGGDLHIHRSVALKAAVYLCCAGKIKVEAVQRTSDAMVVWLQTGKGVQKESFPQQPPPAPNDDPRTVNPNYPEPADLDPDIAQQMHPDPLDDDIPF